MENQTTPPSTPPPSTDAQTTPVAQAPSDAPPPPSASTPPPPAQSTTAKNNKNFLNVFALLAVGVGLVLLGLWFFQSQTKKSETKVTTVQPSIAIAPQKLVVGTDPTYPPMEYLVDNNLAGYDIDLANFLGKELGAQVEFQDIVFDDLFPALESKKIDMIISTVTVTDERKQKYAFSDSYLKGGQVILTKKTDTTIKSTADLQGKKVGVQKGTTMEQEAQKYTADSLVIRYPDYVQATAALTKGEVDAIFADLPGAKGITNDNPAVHIASDPFTSEEYAIVFRKGDPKVKEINEALSSLTVKGILTELKQKWLDQ